MKLANLYCHYEKSSILRNTTRYVFKDSFHHLQKHKHKLMVEVEIFLNQCNKDKAAFFVNPGTWKVQFFHSCGK